MKIPIKVVNTDALQIDTDILVLKHAQDLFGVDWKVFSKLSKLQLISGEALPDYGDFLKTDTYGTITAKEVLFVGTEPLYKFRYQNIREFAYRALAHLGETSPEIERICFTIHGAGYGLDEIEAFESEIAGLVDAISQGKFPQKLKEIVIVEIRTSIAEQLSHSLKELLPQEAVIIKKDNNMGKTILPSSERLRDAGIASEEKPLVFVAMPFDPKMYDVFYYGIRGAVNNAGYLCERVDEAHFTGDVMERVKLRIRQADLVLADLTKANANVYLEVGYAWGIGKPTVLLVQDSNDLKFDVRGQKCLVYSGIRELEEMLHEELKNLPIQE